MLHLECTWNRKVIQQHFYSFCNRMGFFGMPLKMYVFRRWCCSLLGKAPKVISSDYFCSPVLFKALTLSLAYISARCRLNVMHVYYILCCLLNRIVSIAIGVDLLFSPVLNMLVANFFLFAITWGLLLSSVFLARVSH